MAEYCDIQARITHDDPKMRQRLIDAYRRCRVGQEFLPLAKRFLRSERYCVRREIRWGTPEDFGQGLHRVAPPRVQVRGQLLGTLQRHLRVSERR